MAITVFRDELDKPDVEALLALHVAAMHAHSPPEACHVLPGSALADPAITFFTARENGLLLGIGALKRLGSAEGEIKSMRTAPGALGRGVGSAMLSAIIAEARECGYRRLLLETGTTAEFAAANRLYEREGFRDCDAFGGYPESNFTRFLCLDL
nr:GNAT family N-acetyltransferase [uncultured Sphingomonas sp.]